MKKIIILTNIFLLCLSAHSQNISYRDLSASLENLKHSLLENKAYFSGGTNELPYFQAKNGNDYIKFYKSTGSIVTFDLKLEKDYLKLINEIQNKGNFNYKYCSDFDSPVVYNYKSTNGNKIRFNYSKQRISVEYPSKLNTMLEGNKDFTPVFVCLSNDAYAYHTNLKCEGLGNCDSKVSKTNIKEAKNNNYSICERCTTDYSKSSSASSNRNNDASTNSNSQEYYDDYKIDLKNKNSYSKEVTEEQIAKAELMFKKYLPNLLRSKGESASIYSQETSTGDFNNDGIDDIVIKFTYGFGGTAIGGMEAAFYEVKNGEIKVVAGYSPSHRFSIDKIINGTVYATKILYDKDDSQCCPSIRIPIKLKYSNNEILVIQ